MYIETGDKKLPVRYGMNALAQFGDLTGKSMTQVTEALRDFGSLKMSEVLTFIYVGFVDGARKAGEECKIKSVQDVGDLVDEDGELLEKVLKVYTAQSPPPAEGDSKKK